MRFQYTYRNTVGDFWSYYFFNIYCQWTGLINGIFIISALALILSRWQTSGPFLRSVMVLLLSVFVVLQPLALVLRAIKQVELIGDVDTTIIINDDGVTLSVRGHNQFIPWSTYKKTVKRPNFLLLAVDETHGYILPDRITGKDKQTILEFTKEKSNR